MAESEQSITPSDNTNRPLPKKKRLRFERQLIGMMKNKRTCENLKRILAPLIQEMVQEELKRQSPPPVPRSPAYQIQEPDVLCLHLRFKNPLPDPLFTGTSIPPAEIVIRRGNSEETVVSGPSSSISVKMVVLYGDFEREGWTAKEFQDNVVCAREDNSSWTRSGKFRLGVKAVRGRDIQHRIMEARSEAFVVRDKRGESSQKHDCPLLGDEIWRLKNIRENGVYFKRLVVEGIKTVQQFLQFFIINPGHLQMIMGMKKKNWEETLGHARKCIIDGKYYMYSCIETKSTLDNLPPPDKNLVENLKKQAYENRGQIIEYNAQPVFGLSNPHIQAAGIFPSTTVTHQNELARTTYILAPQGHVMTDLPQHQENGQLFDPNHYININALTVSPCQHQDPHFVQNFQLPEQVSMFQNQNDTFGAANVSDNLLGDFMNNFAASGSFLGHTVNDDSLNGTVDCFQKPKALVRGMAWAFISLRNPRSQRMA
ncbi:hypothetical protein MRB53_027978 [Persea americana]|uniref:Uncharacterized protein n=1 Tax=Persea americana TaxID=3435 RepID=A0ACC2KE84_PERAE|nr:hypothetical protein MRB53_027978 [Persea americana]